MAIYNQLLDDYESGRAPAEERPVDVPSDRPDQVVVVDPKRKAITHRERPRIVFGNGNE